MSETWAVMQCTKVMQKQKADPRNIVDIKYKLCISFYCTNLLMKEVAVWLTKSGRGSRLQGLF